VTFYKRFWPGKFITKNKDACVCIIQDEQLIQTINEITKDADYLTAIITINFCIKNIYDDSYLNSISITVKSKLEDEGQSLKGLPIVLQAEVIPNSQQCF